MGGEVFVHNETEHSAALARINELMDAEPGTPEGCELDMLVSAVEEYESNTIYIGLPSLIEAIKFRMEQFGLYSEDLISCIGSEKEVSEVLEGKRQITPSIALALQERLGIPSEILLDKPSISD